MNQNNIDNLIRRCKYMIEYNSSIEDIINFLSDNGCDKSASYLIYMASMILNQRSKDK